MYKNKTVLTERQKAKLKIHSQHHTPKHMTEMKKLMKQGLSFTKAHNEVKKK